MGTLDPSSTSNDAANGIPHGGPRASVTYHANVDLHFPVGNNPTLDGNPAIQIRPAAAHGGEPIGEVEINVYAPLPGDQRFFPHVESIAGSHEGEFEKWLSLDYQRSHVPQALRGLYSDLEGSEAGGIDTATDVSLVSQWDRQVFCTAVAGNTQRNYRIRRFCVGFVRESQRTTLVAIASCGDRGLVLVVPNVTTLYGSAPTATPRLQAGNVSVPLERSTRAGLRQVPSQQPPTVTEVAYAGDATMNLESPFQSCDRRCLWGLPLTNHLQDPNVQKFPEIIRYMRGEMR